MLRFMGKEFPSAFRERVETILRETNLSQTALAKCAGVNKQTVTEWLSGRSKTPRPDSLFAIEDKLGYSARWLATGNGGKKALVIDPTDSMILSNVARLGPEGRNAVRAFIEFELHREEKR